MTHAKKWRTAIYDARTRNDGIKKMDRAVAFAFNRELNGGVDGI